MKVNISKRTVSMDVGMSDEDKIEKEIVHTMTFDVGLLSTSMKLIWGIGIILLVLKLLGIVQWSWWIVLFPMWTTGFGILLLGLLILFRTYRLVKLAK